MQIKNQKTVASCVYIFNLIRLKPKSLEKQRGKSTRNQTFGLKVHGVVSTYINLDNDVV